ncbi:hypothetical protein [Arcanobacterium hippocoleae]|uniref:hypothetical protein n=1 Tax=Arcanobacterium hippocoleae TaxID=149017 RepID=UPI00334205AE
MLKRQFLRFLLGMTVLLAAGCAASNLHSVSLEDVKLTDDIVFALRLSPQLHDGDSFGAATEGYLLLVREDGTADYVDVGLMDHGQLAWARNGLFFGGLETEYLLTNTGLISQSRGTKEEFETSRFVNGKKDGFISVYNVGFAENGYRNRVVSGSQASLAAWEAPGMFMAIAQCGEQIVGITDDRELDFTTRKYISVPETSEVLIQLYPQPENVESRILGQVNRTDLYEYGPAAEYSPCVNGVMYMLAEKYNAHNQDAELVLRSWDTASGAYKEIPLIFSETAKHDFNAESFSSVRGSLNSDASAYHWVSWKDGKVFR